MLPAPPRKSSPLLVPVLLLAAVITFTVAAGPAARGRAQATTRVLVVTGGHDFEEQPFFQVFKDNPSITFRAVRHPDAHAALTPAAAADYDVIVLYDMWQPIDAQARRAFVDVLRAGRGLVALHHCLGSYQDWDEYRRIIGGRYFLKDTIVDGKTWKASTYKHDERIKISVADPGHPVTAGVGPFEILDEVYGGYEVLPDSRPLLTTDHPANTPTLGWWRTYGAARVVYLQLGHDHHAFENPNFRRLLANAVSWAAGKSAGREPGKGSR